MRILASEICSAVLRLPARRGCKFSLAMPSLNQTLPAPLLPARSLEEHRPLLSGLQACDTLADLKALLGRLDRLGDLRRMAAALAPSATDPDAATAAAADPGALPPAARRGTKRPRGQGAGGGGAGAAAEEAALEGQRSGGPPGGRQRGRQAGSSGGGGGVRAAPDAVGRRLRAWLTLDDSVRTEHNGRVLEATPSG